MFEFPAVSLDSQSLELRTEVREFLAAELDAGGYEPVPDCWVSHAVPEFSRKLGQRGWLGMTWPRAYGGHERSPLHRYIVTEEMLAAGAPVAAHWVADRQSGAQLLRYGSEQQKNTILPAIAAGECFFAIGMSEPQAGSDLAAVRTRAERTDNGWQLSGRKIWSTGAHFCHYMIVLARTSPVDTDNRHAGLSQFLVDLNTPGVEISGIDDLSGNQHFNETVFHNVALAADALLGEQGNGWQQVVGELAMERSGPERFLTSFIVLERAMPLLARYVVEHDDVRIATALGKLVAHLKVLRRMSLGIASQLQRGAAPATEAALVKEAGNRYEQTVLHDLNDLLGLIPLERWPPDLDRLLHAALLHLPSNTLRGGTTEILRGIIARQLGMR